jgi:hypothetical protein
VPDPAKIHVFASASRRQLAWPLADGRWWAALVLATAVFAAVVLCVGCTPQELRAADTGASLCATIERIGGAGIVAWDTDASSQLIACARGATTQPDLDACEKQRQAHEAQLAKVKTGADAFDAACTTFAGAVKVAKDAHSSAVPQDVVDLVISAGAKLVRVLVDVGIKLPPVLSGLAGGG